MTAPTATPTRSHTAAGVAAVAGMATTYAALASFVLVFFFTFHATQSVAGDTVSSLVTDAPLWIWLAATAAACSVASVVATLHAVVISDDRPPR